MMMNDEETRSTFDAAFQEAIRDIEVPDDPYYMGEEDGYAIMQPPPPRQMVEERMDSFRRQLMGIASPQTSFMSLSSTGGSSFVGSSLSMSHSSGGQGNHRSPHHGNANAARTDIVVPPRESAPAVGQEYHFSGRREDAVDELLSVGGLSKLSLMSGMSESTLDPHAIAGSHGDGPSGEFIPHAPSRRMTGARGVSTRSHAMSEVSALDFLQETENEDDDQL